MSTPKPNTNVASIEYLLEQYRLPHYRWQAVLHLIRAGNKEGIPELDDLNAAMNYLRRDMASVQKSRRTPQQTLPGSRPSRKPAIKQQPARPQTNATPSASTADEAQPA